MIELNNEQCGKAEELVTSHNELSVFTALEGLMEGEVHVDSAEGAYLQQASQKEPRLYLECLHCYVKANAVEKAQEIVREMTKAEIECDLEELNGAIAYYRSEGLCSAFKAPERTI